MIKWVHFLQTQLHAMLSLKIKIKNTILDNFVCCYVIFYSISWVYHPEI